MMVGFLLGLALVLILTLAFRQTHARWAREQLHDECHRVRCNDGKLLDLYRFRPAPNSPPPQPRNSMSWGGWTSGDMGSWRSIFLDITAAS